VCFQHFVNRSTEEQIGEADDACAQAGRAVCAAGAHGCDAVDELCLSDRHESRIAIRAIHGIALQEEDAGANVVATCIDVAFEFVEQIA